MGPLLFVLGVALMVGGILGLSFVLQRLAASAVRKREAIEAFYVHANAVFDNAAAEVPLPVAEMLQFMASKMCDKNYVRFTTRALIAVRNGGPKPARTKIREAMESLTEDQANHVALAWINSAVVSAETSVVLGIYHRALLHYLLKNPPEGREVREQLGSFVNDSGAFNQSADCRAMAAA